MKSGDEAYNNALITNINDLNAALAKCETDQVTLTCFVNENLTDQARQSLVFKESKTGHGSTIQNEGVRLNQTYMRKFFNNNGKGYGWEVLNETGTRTKKDIKNYMVKTYPESSSNGWQNTKTIVGSSWPKNQSDLEKYQKACMSRNRDENGDGKISDSELKWYLPALDQYIGAWIGADALGEARLYTNNALEGLHYVSSTKRGSNGQGHFMVLWAEEGSAYGDVNGSVTYGLATTKYQLRCIRNYDGGDNIPNVDPTSYYDYSGGVFTMYLLPASYRNPQNVGELSTDGGHLGTDNKLYEKFELGDVKENVSSFDDQKNKADKDESVCSEEVNGGIKDGYIYEKYYTGNWWNTSYAYFKKVDRNGTYGYNKGILSKNARNKEYVMVSKEEAVQTNGWRLPNQREFTLMSIVSALEKANDSNNEYISRTISAFSYGGTALYRGFMFDGTNVHLSNKNASAELTSTKKVRCVRDKI